MQGNDQEVSTASEPPEPIPQEIAAVSADARSTEDGVVVHGVERSLEANDWPVMDLSKHIAYFRSVDLRNPPGDFGSRFAELLTTLQQNTNNTEAQGNANPIGQPTAPPAINALHVTAQNGHFQIAIDHNAEFYRGIHYHVEHSATANFADPHSIHLGPTRNHNEFFGNVTRYFRAAASYGSSPVPPDHWVYFGTKAIPTAVTGGGSVGGPSFQPSKGSGTGAAGVGLQGPGAIPFRTLTGSPPVR